MGTIEKLVECSKEIGMGWGSIDDRCEFCDNTPTRYIRVGHDVVFVCSNCLKKYTHILAYP